MVISPAKRYIFQPYLHPLVMQGHIYLVFFGGASSIGTWATLYLLQWYHIAFIATSAKEILSFKLSWGILASNSASHMPLCSCFYGSVISLLFTSYGGSIAFLCGLLCLAILGNIVWSFYGVILSHTLAIFWAPFSDTYWCLLSLYINGIPPSLMALLGHLFCP